MAEEQFQVTAEEVDKISKALKDDEFRKLFFEYAQEISDPENKQRYEAELIELEKMRGVDMKFLKPTPGYVLKTFILPEGKEKLFVNMCTNEGLDPAEAKIATNSSGKMGESWSVPFSLTPPREDQDKEKNKCTVVDALFHPDTYQRSQQNTRFKQLLVDTALDGIEQNFKIKTDRKKIKTLKLSYKGIPSSAVIRTPKTEVKDRPETVDLGDLPLKVPYPPLKDRSSSKPKQPQPPKEKKAAEPCYSILHSGEFTMQDFTNDRESSRVKRPKNLIVKIELPGVESASSVDLDIYEKRLTLDCTTPLYKLDLALSYPVNSDKGTATFDKAKRTLSVTLPVLPPPPAPLVQPRQLISEIESESNKQGQLGAAELSSQNGDEQPCDSLSDQSENETVNEPTNQVREESATDAKVNEAGIEAPCDSSHQVTDDWSSVGEWCCPPFSHRQDDSSVTFVLHTPGVKEKSMVANFDQNFAQLTYRTVASESYSFYVCFGGGCNIESDDCVVDVSDENVVILLMKDGKGVWEKFQVGLNAHQTKEKLFLTESNVQSAIEEMESLPDPWRSNGLSDAAQVKMVSQSDSRLDIEIVDPAKIEEAEAPLASSESVKEIQDASNPSPSTDEETQATKSGFELDNVTQQTNLSTVESSDPSNEGIGLPQEINSSSLDTEPDKSGADERADSSFVKVETDGSMFVRADADYMESRAKGKVTFDGKTAQGGKLKFSNKLMFSLD